MKTSNKLLILAGLILACLLISYDFSLKAEYEKGTYKNPFKSYSSLPYMNFDKVTVKAANEMKVEIRYSRAFSVQVFDELKPAIDIKQNGGELVIQAKDGDRRNYLGYERGIVISMPGLSEVNASDFIRVIKQEKNSTRTERAYHEDNRVVVSGFDLDALTLNMISNSVIGLKDNRIGNLQALVDGTFHESQLQIDQSDKITNADITVNSRNSLMLTDPDIGRLNHRLSDSAVLVLQGSRAMKLLVK